MFKKRIVPSILQVITYLAHKQNITIGEPINISQCCLIGVFIVDVHDTLQSCPIDVLIDEF